MPRWLPRALVVGTVLVCLGVGGYLGQVWWAKRLVRRSLGDFEDTCGFAWSLSGKYYTTMGPKGFLLSRPFKIACNETWPQCPWYGVWDTTDGLWRPRRVYYEFAKSVTGLDLGDDPVAWQTWLDSHSWLMWDEKRKRLVEPSP